MDNKLVLTGACILNQCLPVGFIVIRAERLDEKPETPCVGTHDLGDFFIGLTMVGRERRFRETVLREEVLATYHLEARTHGNTSLRLGEDDHDAGGDVPGHGDGRDGVSGDSLERRGLAPVGRPQVRDDRPGSDGSLPQGSSPAG